MTYQDLLQDVDFEGDIPNGRTEFITQDSRKAQNGAVFVCVKGMSFDGHKFAKQAIEQGAGLVVTEKRLGLQNELVVPDTRKAYAQMCANFFGRPADKLTIIAVTGTNGKTTISSLLQQVLEYAGHSCALIGTIHTLINGLVIPARFTTPEAWDLEALLARIVAAGCTHVVMEASSQALAQGRLDGIHFELGIFSNLSQDHLDYHKTMENYFSAKASLFKQCRLMLTNADDTYGRKLLEEQPCAENASYSSEGDHADFMAFDVELSAHGVRFIFAMSNQLQNQQAEFAMPGRFSVDNALAIISAAIMLGVDENTAIEGLSQTSGVSGRNEVLYAGSYTIISDFAHTSDALEKLLAAIKPFVTKRLIVLYGCAGDRDPDKRILMGESAAKYGDIIFITSDNPRTEDEQKIINDTLPAVIKSEKIFYQELDRNKAVIQALNLLQDGDVLVLCGKGHEDYQVLNGYTVYLNEHKIVADWVQQKIYPNI